jgi:hypothetical protein
MVPSIQEISCSVSSDDNDVKTINYQTSNVSTILNV